MVALAAGFAGEHSMHHRKFDIAVGDYGDWSPAPRHFEPDDLMMVANYSLGFEENFEMMPSFGALVTYEDAKTFLESHGCSWMGMCCGRMEWWIGTTEEDWSLYRIGTEDWNLIPLWAAAIIAWVLDYVDMPLHSMCLGFYIYIYETHVLCGEHVCPVGQ